MNQSEIGPSIHMGLYTKPRCRVVADLQDNFRVYIDGAMDWSFRGQPGAYGNLIPSLARAFPTARAEAALGAERRLIREFRQSHQRLLAKADDIVRLEHIQEGHDLRCLSVMQHYEVPTRLLDWTTNFWVAVYFACSSHLDQDAELRAYPRKLFSLQRESFAAWSEVLKFLVLEASHAVRFIPKVWTWSQTYCGCVDWSVDLAKDFLK